MSSFGRLGAALFGGRAVWTVAVLGYVLVPDTLSYDHGGSAWSSPVASVVGRVDGYRGEQLLGIAGAIALGAIVARDADSPISFAPVLVLYLLPLGYAAWCASPDAAGAAAAAAGYRLQGRKGVAAIALTCAFHLVAGLVLLAVVVARRPLWRLSPSIVGAGAGVAACVGEWHLQARYLLPGAAIATRETVQALSARRTVARLA